MTDPFGVQFMGITVLVGSQRTQVFAVYNTKTHTNSTG